MAYSAAAVANAFLDLAKRDNKKLTNMQLQKLVYIAHGWCLALLGRPLLYDEINAWQWGPVIPTLYEPLKKYGGGVVSEPLPLIFERSVDTSSVEMQVIEAVWKAYGKYHGLQLSAITHTEGTPWSRIWSEWKYGRIPDEMIKEHYIQLKNERSRRTTQESNA